MEFDCYAKTPLKIQNEIPVFSQPDEYIKNYEKISQDIIGTLRPDGTISSIPKELQEQLENSTIKLIRQYSKEGDKILDVGIGMGRLLENFPKLKRYGMDISFNYLQLAQKKGIDICLARIEDMPYREEFFDIIISTDILEHVLDLNLCCAKILSVLKPNGIWIVRTPYKEDLSNYLLPSYKYKFVHMRNFDEYSLRLLFEKILNCEILETSMAGNSPNSKRLKYNFLYPKGGNIINRLLRIIKAIHQPYYNKLLSKLFYPAEINLVIRKKAQ